MCMLPTSAWMVDKEAWSSWRGNGGAGETVTANSPHSDEALTTSTEDAGEEQQWHLEGLSLSELDRWWGKNFLRRLLECFAAPESTSWYSCTRIVISWDNLEQHRSPSLLSGTSCGDAGASTPEKLLLQEPRPKSEKLTKQQKEDICHNRHEFSATGNVCTKSCSHSTHSSHSSRWSVNIK